MLFLGKSKYSAGSITQQVCSLYPTLSYIGEMKTRYFSLNKWLSLRSSYFLFLPYPPCSISLREIKSWTRTRRANGLSVPGVSAWGKFVGAMSGKDCRLATCTEITYILSFAAMSVHHTTIIVPWSWAVHWEKILVITSRMKLRHTSIRPLTAIGWTM